MSNTAPMLSVIVPVYRTENYLAECLQSIVEQRAVNLEALIINDGSPDRCQAIIDRYCTRHPWMRSFTQTHTGPSTARNLGLDHARGAFITFLDSDDRLPPQAYECLLTAAGITNAEVCTGVGESFTARSKFLNPQMGELSKYAAASAHLGDLPHLARDAAVWNKVFARTLIDRERLRFPAGITLREDLHFSLRAYAAAKRITVLPSIVCHYRARPPHEPRSLTAVVNTKCLEDLVWVGQDLYRTLRASVTPAVIHELQRGLCANIAYRLRPLLAQHPGLADSSTIRAVTEYVQGVEGGVVESIDSADARALLILCSIGATELAAKVAAGQLDEAWAAATAHPQLRRSLAELGAAPDQTTARRPPHKPRWQRVALRSRSYMRHQWSEIQHRHSRTIGRKAKLATARVRSALARSTNAPISWVIGERRGLSAEDTGFHFFRYLRLHHPNLPAYFITSDDAKGAKRVRALGNVLTYGSAAAYEALLGARVLAYSDGCHDFCHRWDRVEPLIRRDAIGCFLQHGVIGANAMNSYYDARATHARRERLQLFVASSPREQQIITQRLGYGAHNVVVTGLSRFDGLAVSAATPRREILILLTWRDWLRGAPLDTIGRSEYFTRIQALVADRRLWSIIDHHDIAVNIGFHFAMEGIESLLKCQHPRINLIDLQTEFLQDWIARAALAVTDYSSVGFDFAYLRRPVLYYQYDADRFCDQRGDPPLDPHTELPGEIITDHGKLIDGIQSSVETGFAVPQEYLRRADNYLPRRDDRNCERIYERICERLDVTESSG